MKKIIISILLGLTLLIGSAISSEPVRTTSTLNQKDQKEETVYITNTGEKYHRESCRHLAKSKIPIKKSDAISRGYEACKVCRP
jgi:hypothetical protein